MKASEIRKRFLEYFERHGHAIRDSSPLVPVSDPTLLFTNAGMVQFKRVFLGEETLEYDRATTSQKCLRVSGKHNDLEEVGVTARHHTFFEMLGNFSFGDYFKREAIAFAWELFTQEYDMAPERLWATVHHTDDEAAELWHEVTGLPRSRILRLGDRDNFWQMGDTGPCGPCSEIHYDLRPEERRGTEVSPEEFMREGETGEFLELWNLVFMQYNRQADGELKPLPAPSVDTGAGLERIASVLQGVGSNYDTDLFVSLIERAVDVVGIPYRYESQEGVSYRVLADHARAVAFLLADGVFPSNEGRGHVLRRILRRGVRHAWLLGRRAPTLVEVVDAVVETMGEAYPQLEERREHLLRYTRGEEERFLETIADGMERFDQIAPPREEDPASDDSSSEESERPSIAGEEAFRLYDTFGFPLDLTQLMAAERGYRVDVEGFERELAEQRDRSRQDRREAGHEVSADELSQGWEELEPDGEQAFVGYQTTELDTEILAFRRENGRLALHLRENPFYAEAGGQVSDRGEVSGDGWTLRVDDVRRLAGRVAVLGDVEGEFGAGEGTVPVHAVVEEPARRDTERNHTATHLLHAALRHVLGEHVVQRGSLVAPDRLRFDFSNPEPMSPSELREVEERVNRAVLQNQDVCVEFREYQEAVDAGAMALFGEKYADTVRVVDVPGVSMELCGGTHVRRTGEIGLFRVMRESGVAAGVRRIEAVTGWAAYRRSVEQEDLIREAADALGTPPDNLLQRISQLLEENRDLQRSLQRARTEGVGDVVGDLLERSEQVDGARIVTAELDMSSNDEMRTLGDRLRERLGSGAAVIAARFPDKTAFFAVSTDDLIEKGVRADRLVRDVAKVTGASGGGRPHMAQGGVGDQERVREALDAVLGLVRSLMQEG